MLLVPRFETSLPVIAVCGVSRSPDPPAPSKGPSPPAVTDCEFSVHEETEVLVDKARWENRCGLTWFSIWFKHIWTAVVFLCQWCVSGVAAKKTLSHQEKFYFGFFGRQEYVAPKLEKEVIPFFSLGHWNIHLPTPKPQPLGEELDGLRLVEGPLFRHMFRYLFKCLVFTLLVVRLFGWGFFCLLCPCQRPEGGGFGSGQCLP